MTRGAEGTSKSIAEYQLTTPERPYFDENLRTEHLIKKTIASSVRSAFQEMNIKLIICLTETGSTISYLTGYNFGCPILAVCSDYRVSRNLVARKSVFTVPVGSLVGYESVIEK